MTYIGVDLAWGEGTAAKRANETGLALLDESGVILDAGWARGIDAVTEWVVDRAGPGTVIAIDAPLVIPNESGMRLAERQVGMAYGNRKVAANASNTAMGWQGGVALLQRLEVAGFAYTDGIRPPTDETPVFFECYPYTTLVGMAELGYDVERPRYKRLDKTLTAPLGRERRARECDELIRRMLTLDDARPPLRLASHPLTRELAVTPSPIDDVPYKHREDLLDAVLCAWTAAIWHRFGDERTQILGADDTPDARGRRATIVAPARPEQRVAGRPMRAPAARRGPTVRHPVSARPARPATTGSPTATGSPAAPPSPD
ncbi:DUF429 domain-containing protein [Marisediminicola sp. LYQ85]|uniref:DUF429 domain-containing protein n=1 Tax=Marisediminicola sp. LYQ85 TaxID=3391062 RepID=UPI0039832A28